MKKFKGKLEEIKRFFCILPIRKLKIEGEDFYHTYTPDGEPLPKNIKDCVGKIVEVEYTEEKMQFNDYITGKISFFQRGIPRNYRDIRKLSLK